VGTADIAAACGECAFWVAETPARLRGECRRRLPRATREFGRIPWAWTAASGWCGEGRTVRPNQVPTECGGCLAFRLSPPRKHRPGEDEQPKGHGVCRRHAPERYPQGGNDASAGARWPPTRVHYWCGDGITIGSDSA
jgi:hypothetical protein